MSVQGCIADNRAQADTLTREECLMKARRYLDGCAFTPAPSLRAHPNSAELIYQLALFIQRNSK